MLAGSAPLHAALFFRPEKNRHANDAIFRGIREDVIENERHSSVSRAPLWTMERDSRAMNGGFFLRPMPGIGR
jgi:hypothetical protein